MAYPAFSESSPVPQPDQDRVFTVTPSTPSSPRRKPGPEPASGPDLIFAQRCALLSSLPAQSAIPAERGHINSFTVLDADVAGHHLVSSTLPARGGRLMISHRILPSRSAADFAAMISICRFIANWVRAEGTLREAGEAC